MRQIYSIMLLSVTVLFSSSCNQQDTAPPPEELVDSSQNLSDVNDNISEERSPVITTPDAVQNEEFYAGSQSCMACHAEQFKDWKTSQHAGAARPFDSGLDAGDFEPGHEVKYGSVESAIRLAGELPEVTTLGPSGEIESFEPEAVIAIEPLKQYVVPFEGGRMQVLDLAFDPEKHEWFNVYGEEDRRSEEWGFWTNRGMNWNSQCAYCHMTNLEKNYDLEADTYSTTWSEWGVSCEQCHGPMGQHAKLGGPVANPKISKELVAETMSSCASCHTRREELTGAFTAGELFYDHYRPTLPSNANIYYPDGQILEEDFEYGSFILSKMHNSGVTCLDCHNPHSGKLVLPLALNRLCMSCHGEPSLKLGTPMINPTAHSHHTEWSTGNSCVECHMAKTTYMMRDPRRDHGFMIPDPLMTKELGIPNSCNRCHEDKTVDWAVEWSGKWYPNGISTSFARERTRLIARAQAGDESVVPEMVAWAKEEAIPAWRSTMVALLSTWYYRPDVQEFLVESLKHESPLVRTEAIRSLEFLPEAEGVLEGFLDDPVRMVRLDTAWALRQHLDDHPEIQAELKRYVENQSDQPTGAMRHGELALSQGRSEEAIEWFKKSAEWSPGSAWFHHRLGVVYHLQGQTENAIVSLGNASTIEPDNADHYYALALLYGETGDIFKAIHQFERAVTADADFARAWYNLGLARAQAGQLEGGIAALLEAESVAPEVADFPYARATLHYRLQQMDKALEAGKKALAIAPNSQQYQQFVMQLERGQF